MSRRLTTNQINSIDTYEFWEYHNIQPRLIENPSQSSNYMLDDGHDSLMIYPFGLLFASFNDGENGGAFDLLQRVGYDKIEAAIMLHEYVKMKEHSTPLAPINKKENIKTQITRIPKETKFYQPFRNDNRYVNEVKNYLIYKRQLNPKIVDWLFENDLAYANVRRINYYDNEKEKHYAEYVALNFNCKIDGEIIGQEIHGTRLIDDSNEYIDKIAFKTPGYFKFKRFFTNQNLFNFEIGYKINQVYVFESAIDLLSYLELKGKENNSKYISLFGAATHIDMLEKYLNDDIKTIYVCTDTDDGGVKAYDKAVELYSDKFSVKQIKPLTKDWNDDLKKYKNEINNKTTENKTEKNIKKESDTYVKN